jgi:hypothetical protein
LRSIPPPNPVTLLTLFRMPEVQLHGFTWQNDFMRNVYGATEEEIRSIPYTAETDLPSVYNRLDNVPVSFKTSCSPNTVCMGDCLRVFDSVNKETPLHITVIQYQQDDERNVKKLKEATQVNLTDSREILFGYLQREEIERLDKLVKSVPQRRKPTPEEHTAMYTLQMELQAKSGALYMNIKCNSQQSRLQCSFNQFQKFLDTYPDRVIAKSNTSDFRGHQVMPELESGRRQFRRRTVEQ